MERTRGGAGLRIQLLGGFRVWVGSRLIPDAAWRRRKAAALVKLLALAPEHRLHREEVLELLWPGLSPDAGENNLHRTLHLGRHALEPDLPRGEHSPYLCLQGDLLVLCPEVWIHVDVDAFTQAATAARASHAPARYEAAIDLSTGELLPEDQYEDWAAVRRDELRKIYHDLLRRLSRLYEGRGEDAQAIEVLQRLLRSEPSEEGAHTDLMRLYALSGQRQEALRQYERLEWALQREVEVEPSVRARRLHEEIRAGCFPPKQLSAVDNASALGFVSGQLTDAGAVTARDGQNWDPTQDEPPNPFLPPNLPRHLSSFIGREQEIAEVKNLLSLTRFLTLTGTGGVGKSRLALEVAGQVADEYAEGVWLVQLAALSDPRLVPYTVARVVGVHEQPDRSMIEVLVDFLRPRKALLVLDNCEHLHEACAELVSILFESCPSLGILATSRRALGISGEPAWRVPSLAVPDPEDFTVDCLSRYDAVALFLERSRSVWPDFAPSPANASAIVEVCRRLEGIPLAIELAAARTKVLTVEQLSERLDDCFTVLGGRSSSPLPRHGTLRAAMDWSYDLLAEPEQVLLRRLAVFAGGWTLEAAEGVCSGDGIEEPEVLALLAELVDQSLVGAEKAGPLMRYRLLEPVRQYAEHKLVESGEAETARRRHRDWYRSFAERAAPKLTGAEQVTWLTRLESERDNLRAALSQSLERGEVEPALHLAAALWRFWYAHSYLREGRRWLETALALDEDDADPARAEALTGAGILACSQGDYPRGRVLHEAALDIWQRLENPLGVATALDNLGQVAHYEGDLERAATLNEEGLTLRRRLGDSWGAALSLTHLGTTLRDRGDCRRAMALSQEALQLYDELRDQEGMAVALNDLGRAAHEQDDVDGARGFYVKSLALWERLGHRAGIATALNNLGRVAYEKGDLDRAVALLVESLRMRQELGDRWGVAGVLSHLGRVAYEQGDLQRAADRHIESLSLCRELQDRRGITYCLDGLASVARAGGQLRLAAVLCGAATALYARVGAVRYPYFRTTHHRNVAALPRALGEETFDAAWKEGWAMTIEQAVQAALAVAPPWRPVKGPLLTEREDQVARLLAAGRTNQGIADDLNLARRTVEVHVYHILKKLGCASRQDVANWAREPGPDPFEPGR